MKVTLIIAIFLSWSFVAYAGPVQYVDPLDGLSFEYENRQWDLAEGSISGTAILTRNPKRGSGKIIISRHKPMFRSRDQKSMTMDVSRAGRKYFILCSADHDDYMFAYFSCGELSKSISVERMDIAEGEDDLSRLPSARSITDSALQRALYMLLSGAEGCSDAGIRIGDSGNKSSRIRAIADLISGKRTRARKTVRGLVNSNAKPIDYILLGLSSSKRSDFYAWRAACARGEVQGSLIDYWQGVVAQQEGRVEEAASFFERAYKESQSDLAAAKLARISMNAGDLENARRWWRIMGDASLAKAALTIELARRDNSPEDSLWVFNHYEGAWCGAIGASAATSAAKAAIARGQRKLARSLLNRAIKYDRDHGPAYKTLAKMAVEDGQSNEEVAKVLLRYLPHADAKERRQLLSIIDDL